jgi:hypothetical protein
MRNIFRLVESPILPFLVLVRDRQREHGLHAGRDGRVRRRELRNFRSASLGKEFLLPNFNSIIG